MRRATTTAARCAQSSARAYRATQEQSATRPTTSPHPPTEHLPPLLQLACERAARLAAAPFVAETDAADRGDDAMAARAVGGGSGVGSNVLHRNGRLWGMVARGELR